MTNEAGRAHVAREWVGVTDPESERFAQLLGDDFNGVVIELGGGDLGDPMGAVRVGGAQPALALPDEYHYWRAGAIPANQLWPIGEAVSVAEEWVRQGRVVAAIAPV